jgi:leader peptidase (prepilin peptidase)/N-methyltransferase
VRASLLFLVIVAVAVAASMASAPGPLGFLGSGLAVTMVAIATIDWRRFIIPNWLNVIAFVLALVHAAVREPGSLFDGIVIAILRAAAVALVFLAIRYGYALVRGRQGLGLGDVKLAAVAGAWLDWIVIPIAVEVAAFTALTAYLARQLTLGRSISATNRIPFGTFFAPAIWLSWLLQMFFF